MLKKESFEIQPSVDYYLIKVNSQVNCTEPTKLMRERAVCYGFRFRHCNALRPDKVNPDV